MISLHDVTVCVRCMWPWERSGGVVMHRVALTWSPTLPSRSVPACSCAMRRRALPLRRAFQTDRSLCYVNVVRRRTSPCFDPCFDPTSHQGPPGPGGPGAPGGFTVSTLRIRHSRFASGAARGARAATHGSRSPVYPYRRGSVGVAVIDLCFGPFIIFIILISPQCGLFA